MASSRFGAPALSAHAVVLQLWMVVSFVVDGFADVGTMLGSKLLGARRDPEMKRLTLVVAALGMACGICAALLLWLRLRLLLRAAPQHIHRCWVIGAWPILLDRTPLI